MIESKLCPTPREMNLSGRTFSVPNSVEIQMANAGGNSRLTLINERLTADLPEICRISTGGGYAVKLSIGQGAGHPEGYRLKVDEDGCEIIGDDADGLQHGCQTLLQIFALNYGMAEVCEIKDWPHYKTRSIMLDMGRAVYSYDYIKRVIRIMSRLKLNSLHLHLFDDHINSIRFETLPLGHENPFALSIPEYGELIRYARSFGIEVVPEFESWGHAGSIVYHYPELQGVPGMYTENFSFPIGTKTFDVLEQMYDEFFPVLEDKCQFHLGLDEARWEFDANEAGDRSSFETPEKMVGKFHSILTRLGEKHGKDVTMRIWADHKGRPVPEEIQDKIIIEPWNYWEAAGSKVDEDLSQYGNAGQMRLIMGGGMSGGQPQGEYIATGMWCKKAMDLCNVEGVNITVWCTNNLPDVLIGVYVGANFAWSPESPANVGGDYPHDRHRGMFLRLMKEWQGYFKDADRELMLRDRGPEIFNGFYVGGDKHNQPVSPTAEFIRKANIERGIISPFDTLDAEIAILCGKKKSRA